METESDVVADQVRLSMWPNTLTFSIFVRIACYLNAWPFDIIT